MTHLPSYSYIAGESHPQHPPYGHKSLCTPPICDTLFALRDVQTRISIFSDHTRDGISYAVVVKGTQPLCDEIFSHRGPTSKEGK